MNYQVAGHQVEGYKVMTDVFSGPLDLLLELIERAELDITRLALAQVTDQYLAYMHAMKDYDPAEVSAFLVMAARLLQIKSAALLPRPPVVEAAEEEDNAEALVLQLIQYRKFKQVAVHLDDLQAAGHRTYLRITPPTVSVEAKLDLSDLSLEGLIRAARTVFWGDINLQSLDKVVSMPRVTIREKIHSILAKLSQGSVSTFRTMLLTRERVEVVVTFLAMLELIKRHVLDFRQAALFEDILIERTEMLENEDEIELEFGE
jgi:segregation and condensation protein A